jgi:hypothetical protein
LIVLAFLPVRGESPVIVRGAYFRISADGTLHGPDNAVVAKYLNGLWQLMHGRHRVFDCSGPVFLVARQPMSCQSPRQPAIRRTVMFFLARHLRSSVRAGWKSNWQRAD